MSVLKFTLIICALAGCWQPPTWTSQAKDIMYKIYAIFLGSSLYILSWSQFMNIVLEVDNPDDFVEAMYMMLCVFVAGYKLVSMWVDRKIVTTMVNALTEKPFKPSESYELIIREKFDKMVQDTTMRYLILVMMSVVSIIFTSLFTILRARGLTYRVWLPFDYTTSPTYFVVYFHQLIGMTTSGIVNVGCESLLCGFLLHICCQFEILEYRLTKIGQSKEILRDCVRHHNLIFEYAYMVNHKFTRIIAIQFLVSILAVCSNLYRIATAKDADYTKFIPLMLYTGCMLSQIFIYCWFGNKVKLKSLYLATSIYNMEWPALNNANKKDLLIIMKRSMIPIEFSSAYLITMNVESFVSVLKTSYSAFNLLRTNE